MCKNGELNPVQAGLVKIPEEWHWSSAEAHMKNMDDILVKAKPLCEIVKGKQVCSHCLKLDYAD